MPRLHLLPWAMALGLYCPMASTQAGEIYSQIGLPGLMLGYAHPVSKKFGVRVEWATLGTQTDQRSESGIDYDGVLKADRTALFADWFPFEGGFRLTGGLSANQYRLALAATGAGGNLTIGNTTYVTTAADRLDVRVRFPSTTPYLGLGWGHASGTGLRFSADLGVMIGRATVGATVSGPLAGQVTPQDLDAELADLRAGVGRVRAIPQLSLGLGYSF